MDSSPPIFRGLNMREIINIARVKGLYHGKHINSISEPWKITVRHKYHCICERICETFPIADVRDAQSRVYYNGVQQFEWNHSTLLAVGYEVCTGYIDSKGHEKKITHRGNVLFFNPANDSKYRLRIPNPPSCKVSKNQIITKFAVMEVVSTDSEM